MAMVQPRTIYLLALPLGLAALSLTGCATTCCMPVGPDAAVAKELILFPIANRLIPSACEIRSTMTEPQPLPRELDKRPAPAYTVEPGDVVLIQLAQPAATGTTIHLPDKQTILLDGTIDLAAFGRVIVMGQTLGEIEATVRSTIQAQAKKDPGQVVATVVTRTSKVYYVLGDVNKPGAYTLNGRETVLDGILAAGGLSARASRRDIVLSRPSRPESCRTVLPICYNEIVQLGDTSTNYQLLPGDRIYVASRSFWDHLHCKKDCPPCGGPQVSCGSLVSHPFIQPSAHELISPMPRQVPATPPDEEGPVLKSGWKLKQDPTGTTKFIWQRPLPISKSTRPVLTGAPSAPVATTPVATTQPTAPPTPISLTPARFPTGPERNALRLPD